MTASLRQRAELAVERITALGAISEEPDRLTRRFATPALVQASELTGDWMRKAGMDVHRDAIGNVVGRLGFEGHPDRVVAFGSHLDTVRGAGSYDGVLGVVAAIAAVERVVERGIDLPFAIEVIGFAEEEGSRFGTPYLGSSAYCGNFNRSCLDLADQDGVTMAEALLQVDGQPDAIETCAADPTSLIGYCEVHIEQGPVLESEGLPVGVVSAIAGQTRLRATFTGKTGHAGTVPMAMRHDALAGASELVLAVEAVGREEPGLVATTGELLVASGSSNVVPSSVTISVDVRHADDATREWAVARIQAHGGTIAAKRRLHLGWEELHDITATQTSAKLTDLLSRAIEAEQQPVRTLVSGAGHDAAVMARIAPVAMLFVRCAGGISHSPEEFVTEQDIATALGVIDCFIELLVRAVGLGEAFTDEIEAPASASAS